MKLRLILLSMLALALLAAPALAADNAVKVATSQAHVKYLTDGAGITLYWFKNDSPGMSACFGGCVDNWPLFYRESVEPADGLKAEDFGTITRSDGKKQTTFRGYPLYYFAADVNPGEMHGQGMIGRWFTVDPDSFPAK
jgi:predicted lipoprotein with Yx(FWY)xxD motif